MPFRQAALALFSLAVLTGPSAAQTATPPPVNQNCLVGGQQGIGLAPIAAGCPMGRAPALSSFRFGFFNGDHRFRQVTLLPNNETFDGAWADVGGEDPWYIEARWHRVPEAPGGVVTAVVQGVADIPIRPGPANHTLVLSGFEFKRADGTDANIRTIAIATDSATATIRTVLLDDQGADYTNLARAIAVGFAFGATGVPDPNMSFAATGVANSLFNNSRGARLVPGEPQEEFFAAENAPPLTPMIIAPGAFTGTILRPGTATTPPPARRVEVFSPPSARAYQVRVAYLWVPNARLRNTRMVSGGGRTRNVADTSGSLPTGNHVLHGFSFHFDNSDHFIGGFGVHLRGNFPVRNIPERRDHVITWEDANHDDPIRWTTRFSDLR
jgi:hypothetical protein